MSNKKILLIGGHDDFVLHAAVRAIGMKIGYGCATATEGITHFRKFPEGAEKQ